MRNVGELVEFHIIPGLWRLGIIDTTIPNSPIYKYFIRFVRDGEEYHQYYYAREEDVRDVI